MRQIRINVQNIMTNVVVSKRNEINVSIVKNIFAKEKVKGRKANIDIGDNSWKIVTI